MLKISVLSRIGGQSELKQKTRLYVAYKKSTENIKTYVVNDD